MSKIEKIRQKIDRMLDDICDADGFVQKKDEPRYDALAEVLNFIDALEEEPDKSLEEAAEEYLQKVKAGFLRTLDHPTAKDCFIHGAEWQKEQFEKNRLAHCDAASQEDCDRETDFAMEIIEKEHRQPTFLDAINYGMRLQKDALMEWIQEVRTIPHENAIIRDLAFQEVVNKLNSM